MKRFISILLIVSFFVTQQIGMYPVYAQDFHICPISCSATGEDFRLPEPGVMVPLSPEFNPAILKGIKVHPDNPFRFDFILDQGDSFVIPAKAGIQYQEQLKTEANRLIKYFLASLTIPEKDLWVNLSPYEKDRIIPNTFGLTEMGRDLLAEDYMLKQITASLIYPEDKTGKKFWKRVYEEAAKRFGTTNIPVNTFNKVWIVPDKAVVYENAKAGTAYVVEAKLKVMLEQDYLALSHNVIPVKTGIQDTSVLGNQIIREIVIPELTKEVNEDKNFTQLRQVYNSLILATWYKKKIRDSILEQVYADKNKIAGVQYTSTVIPAKAGIQNKNDVESIYQQYLLAFKKGVYNYIKEDQDPLTQQTVPRKYFSGGVSFFGNMAMTTVHDPAMLGVDTGRNVVVSSQIENIADSAMTVNPALLTEALDRLTSIFEYELTLSQKDRVRLLVQVQRLHTNYLKDNFDILESRVQSLREALEDIITDGLASKDVPSFAAANIIVAALSRMAKSRGYLKIGEEMKVPSVYTVPPEEITETVNGRDHYISYKFRNFRVDVPLIGNPKFPVAIRLANQMSMRDYPLAQRMSEALSVSDGIVQFATKDPEAMGNIKFPSENVRDEAYRRMYFFMLSIARKIGLTAGDQAILTVMTTFDHRLDRSNKVIWEMLQGFQGRSQPVIYDIGIGFGDNGPAPTKELAEGAPNAWVMAIDRQLPDYQVITPTWQILYDAQGKLLSVQKDHNFYIGYSPKVGKEDYFKSIFDEIRQRKNGTYEFLFKGETIKVIYRPMDLHQAPNIQYVAADLFNLSPQAAVLSKRKADIVRIANVIFPHYDAKAITPALQQLFPFVNEGGKVFIGFWGELNREEYLIYRKGKDDFILTQYALGQWEDPMTLLNSGTPEFQKVVLSIGNVPLTVHGNTNPADKDRAMNAEAIERPHYIRTVTNWGYEKNVSNALINEIFDMPLTAKEQDNVLAKIRQNPSLKAVLLKEMVIRSAQGRAVSVVLTSDKGIIPGDYLGKTVTLGSSAGLLLGNPRSLGLKYLSQKGWVRVKPSGNIIIKVHGFYLLTFNHDALKEGKFLLSPPGGGYWFTDENGMSLYEQSGISPMLAVEKKPLEMHRVIPAEKLGDYVELFNNGTGRELTPLREFKEELLGPDSETGGVFDEIPESWQDVSDRAMAVSMREAVLEALQNDPDTAREFESVFKDKRYTDELIELIARFLHVKGMRDIIGNLSRDYRISDNAGILYHASLLAEAGYEILAFKFLAGREGNRIVESDILVRKDGRLSFVEVKDVWGRMLSRSGSGPSAYVDPQEWADKVLLDHQKSLNKYDRYDRLIRLIKYGNKDIMDQLREELGDRLADELRSQIEQGRSMPLLFSLTRDTGFTYDPVRKRWVLEDGTSMPTTLDWQNDDFNKAWEDQRAIVRYLKDSFHPGLFVSVVFRPHKLFRYPYPVSTQRVIVAPENEGELVQLTDNNTEAVVDRLLAASHRGPEYRVKVNLKDGRNFVNDVEFVNLENQDKRSAVVGFGRNGVSPLFSKTVAVSEIESVEFPKEDKAMTVDQQKSGLIEKLNKLLAGSGDLYRDVMQGTDKVNLGYGDLRPMILGAIERKMDIESLSIVLFHEDLVTENMAEQMPVFAKMEELSRSDMEFGLQSGRMYKKNQKFYDALLNMFGGTDESENMSNSLARMSEGNLRILGILGVLSKEEVDIFVEKDADALARVTATDNSLKKRLLDISESYKILSASNRRRLLNRFIPLSWIRPISSYYGISMFVGLSTIAKYANFTRWIPMANVKAEEIKDIVGGRNNAWRIIMDQGLGSVDEWIKTAEAKVDGMQNTVGGRSNAWRIVITQGLNKADAWMDSAKTKVEEIKSRVGGAGNAWSIVLSQGLGNTDLWTQRAQAVVDRIQGAVGGYGSAWQIVINQGLNNIDAWIAKAQLKVQEIQGQVGGPSLAWSIVVGQGLNNTDDWVAKARVKVAEIQRRVGGSRNAWFIVIARGFKNIDPWVNDAVAEVGRIVDEKGISRTNAWQIVISRGLDRAMTVEQYADVISVNHRIARHMADLIKAHNELKEKTVFILPTGGTSVRIYDTFVRIVRAERIDLSRLITFNMDEYYVGKRYSGIWNKNKNSYAYFMEENLFGPLRGLNLGWNDANAHILNGQAEDIDQEVNNFEDLIKKEGPVDLVLGGIGRDGHIAFNEPIIKIDTSVFNVDTQKITDFNEFYLVSRGRPVNSLIKDVLYDHWSYRKSAQFINSLTAEFTKLGKLFKEQEILSLVKKIFDQKVTIYLDLTDEQIKDKAVELQNQVDAVAREMGLNSPSVEFKSAMTITRSRTRHVQLALPTIIDNARFLDNIAQIKLEALTVGVGTLMDAKEIMIAATGDNKAFAVHASVDLSPSPEVTASYLQDHPHSTFVVDAQAASALNKPSADLAMAAKGGIDLTPANMNLQTQNSGQAIKFHIDPAMLEQLQNAAGFVPVIINIQPLVDLKSFLNTR